MRITKYASLAGIALALSFGLGAADAQDYTVDVDNLWFVELSDAPAADGTRIEHVRSQQAAFRKTARDAGIEYKERRSFGVLFNGFSIEADASQRALIASLPGVRALWPIEVIDAPEPPTDGGSHPDLTTALAMTNADRVHSVHGYTGAGIRVAVMDTGIDYDHPDFGGDGVARQNSPFFPNERVVAGWDFVGDDFTAGLEPQPNPYPDDCGGHGTHVAGIVGANGDLTGVAPDVLFGAYRVFGCSGSTTADIMLAAMEMALADDMHVLNMSIGARAQWPQYPTGAAATRLTRKGMVVVASIGNNGPGGSVPDGPYAAGAPGVGHDVIGVASYNNTHLAQQAFTVDPGNMLVGFNRATASALPPSSGSLTVSRLGAEVPEIEGCFPSDFAGFPAGHMALTRRGGCTFHIKAANAQAAGAAALIIYNNAAGAFNPTVAGDTPIVIPVVAISQVDGDAIHALAGEGETTLTWGTQTVSAPNAGGGLISSFSSFGLAADLTLKPDIGAPGGNIFSTIPLEQGGYGQNSGTSMSAPHVAGAVALLRQAHPNMPAGAVRARLQNSAKPTLWSGNPGLGFLEPVNRQGAGLLDIEDAITASIDVTPGKLSLGESEAGPRTQRLTLRNNSNTAVTLALSHVTSLSVGPKNPQVFQTVSHFGGGSTVAFSADTVTVPAGKSRTVDVTITAPATPALGQYGGYVVLTDADGGRDYHVPYAGFIGDYQQVQVLTSAHLTNGNPILRPDLSIGPNEPVTFNPDQGEIAWMIVHRSHHIRYWEFRILHAGTLAPIHPVFANFWQDEYVGRSLSGTAYTGYGWDGTRMHSAGKSNLLVPVPSGDYVIQLRLLKALGDRNNPDHWETWTSPVVTLVRDTESPGGRPVTPPGRR